VNKSEGIRNNIPKEKGQARVEVGISEEWGGGGGVKAGGRLLEVWKFVPEDSSQVTFVHARVIFSLSY
jgi:hypothetical protein